MSKIETFVKNWNFCQKSKLLSEIETFVENWNFYQKSKLLSKIETFVKNRNFCRKSKLLSKIESFVRDRNFCQQSKLLSKIETFVKNRNFYQKIETFVKNRNFCQKSKLLSKIETFVKKSKLLWIFEYCKFYFILQGSLISWVHKSDDFVPECRFFSKNFEFFRNILKRENMVKKAIWELKRSFIIWWLNTTNIVKVILELSKLMYKFWPPKWFLYGKLHIIWKPRP